MVKARVGANPLSKIFQSIFWSLLHTKSQPQLLLGQACLASTTNECSYWPRSLLLDHFNPSSMQPLVLSEFADFLALSQVSKYSPASAVGRGSKTSRVITAIFWPYWFVHQILPVFYFQNPPYIILQSQLSFSALLCCQCDASKSVTNIVKMCHVSFVSINSSSKRDSNNQFIVVKMHEKF